MGWRRLKVDVLAQAKLLYGHEIEGFEKERAMAGGYQDEDDDQAAGALAASGRLERGTWFAFLRPPFPWRGMTWLEDHPRVLSRLGCHVLLPAGTLSAVNPLLLDLAILCSDRALYREHVDPACLLAYDPMQTDRKTIATVYQNGVPLRQEEIALNSLGAGTLKLEGLQGGEYEVFWGKARCAFRVASYQLAPLEARVLAQERTGQNLELELGLNSYGEPFEGPVDVRLRDPQQCLRSATAQTRNGVLRVFASLSGEGPFCLELQSLADPSRTAMLPLMGTSWEYRTPTVLSGLGEELVCSLLPSEGCQESRGLYLTKGASLDSPFRMEQLEPGRVRLIATRAVEAACVVIHDPSCWHRPGHPTAAEPRAQLARLLFDDGHHDDAASLLASPATPAELFLKSCLLECKQGLRSAYAAGYRFEPPDRWLQPALQPFREVLLPALGVDDSVDLDLPAPVGVLFVGAIDRGEPWEARVVLPVASELQVSIEASSDASEMVFQSDARQLYVVVKDARLVTPTTPGSALAARLKDYAENRGERDFPAVAQTKADAEGASKSTPTPLRLGPPWAGAIAQVLLAEGIVSQEKLAQIEALALGTKATVAELLVREGLVQEEQLYKLWAEYLEVPLVSLAPEALNAMDPDWARLIPEDLARRYGVLVLGHDDHNEILLGMLDPLDELARDDIALITGFTIKTALIRGHELMAALNHCYGVTDLVEIDGCMRDVADRDFATPEGGDSPDDEGDGSGFHQGAPQTLFAGLVDLHGGRASIQLPKGESREVLVEVLALADFDWSFQRQQLSLATSPTVSLQAPPFVWPEDEVQGRLVVSSGDGTVQLWRDGQEILSQAASKGESIPFPAMPGSYRAQLTGEDGACHEAVATIGAPGRFVSRTRTVAVLSEGETLSPDGVENFLVLRDLTVPLTAMLEGVRYFGHDSCISTVHKLFSAALCYLSARTSGRRAELESGLRAGVASMRIMYVPGQGFRANPYTHRMIDPDWGAMVALYLQELTCLHQTAVSPALQIAIVQALELAADACRTYATAWPPYPPRNGQEAYAVLRFGSPGQQQEMLGWAKSRLLQIETTRNRVAYRTEAAFLAAILLASGNPQSQTQALRLAHTVLRDIEPNGRLYSTEDSMAAAALLTELSRLASQCVVEWDGQRLSLNEAATRGEGQGSLKAAEGPCLVHVTRRHTTDWSHGVSGLLQVRLEAEVVKVGESLKLHWEITGGYEFGDVLWVCLPDALSRLDSGGQLKMFSIDLQDDDEGQLEVTATATTPHGRQHFLACLRNMYDEERLGPSEPLSIQVLPRDQLPSATNTTADLTDGSALGALLGRDAALERADALLEKLEGGSVEFASGRDEQGWITDPDFDDSPVPNQEILLLTAGLLSVAHLDPRSTQLVSTTFTRFGRTFGLVMLPTDCGVRARVTAL